MNALAWAQIAATMAFAFAAGFAGPSLVSDVREGFRRSRRIVRGLRQLDE